MGDRAWPKTRPVIFLRKKVDDAELSKMYDSHLKVLSVFAIQYRLSSYARPRFGNLRSRAKIWKSCDETISRFYIELQILTTDLDANHIFSTTWHHQFFFEKKTTEHVFGQARSPMRIVRIVRIVVRIVDYLAVEWEFEYSSYRKYRKS